MQAAFVNIGQDVNAFLPFSEISDSELIVEKQKNSKLKGSGCSLATRSRNYCPSH